MEDFFGGNNIDLNVTRNSLVTNQMFAIVLRAIALTRDPCI